jgi:hypothetical protein
MSSAVYSSGLENLVYAHHDFIDYKVDHRLVGLRNRVYDAIEHDMDEVMKWMRKRYGVSD